MEQSKIFDKGKFPLGEFICKHTEQDLRDIDYILKWLDKDYLVAVAKVMDDNAAKHGIDNWKKGGDPIRRVNSAVRHAKSIGLGERIDTADKHKFGNTHAACLGTNGMILDYWQRHGRCSVVELEGSRENFSSTELPDYSNIIDDHTLTVRNGPKIKKVLKPISKGSSVLRWENKNVK